MTSEHRFRIYLALEREKKLLGAQLSRLFDHFDLLPKYTRDIKRFKLMLQTSYFTSDTRLPILFGYLYQAYRNSAKHIKGSILLQKCFGRTDFKADRTQLIALIRELENLVLTFCREQYLKKNPIESAQLNVELARNHSHIELYDRLLNKWQKEIEKLNDGTKKRLHQWRKNHHALINTQSKKHNTKRLQALAKVANSLEYLNQLVHLIYEHDSLSHNIQYVKQVDINKHSNDFLVTTYQKSLRLRNLPSFSLAEYRSTQDLIMKYGPCASQEHHFILWQIIVNYISTHYRHGKAYLRRELLFWLHYQEHYSLLKSFKHISRSVFLNNLLILLLNHELDLARTWSEEFSLFLVDQNKELTLRHAQVAIAFYDNKYEEVNKLLEKYFKKNTLNTYVDAPRLKSYQLRSLLYLITLDIGKYTPLFKRTFQDFDVYLQRQKSKMNMREVQFFRTFLRFCNQIFNAMDRLVLNEKRAVISTKIRNADSCHSREWLLNFLYTTQQNRRGQLQPNQRVRSQLPSCAIIHE